MIETPFNYTGSKFKLLDQILSRKGKKETVEVVITNYDINR